MRADYGQRPGPGFALGRRQAGQGRVRVGWKLEYHCRPSFAVSAVVSEHDGWVGTIREGEPGCERSELVVRRGLEGVGEGERRASLTHHPCPQRERSHKREHMKHNSTAGPAPRARPTTPGEGPSTHLRAASSPPILVLQGRGKLNGWVVVRARREGGGTQGARASHHLVPGKAALLQRGGGGRQARMRAMAHRTPA